MEDKKDKQRSVSDEELLAQAKGGYKPAFDIFYERYKRRILNYVYRMVGARERAEDIAQDVFIKAYLALGRYESRGKALHWLYTIAGNLCRNFARDNRLRPKLSLDKEVSLDETAEFYDIVASEAENPRDIAVSKETEAIVHKHIMLLPEKYREVLVLCDIQGCSYEDVASILKCKIGSVGSRLSKARMLLAEKLKRYMGINDLGSGTNG